VKPEKKKNKPVGSSKSYTYALPLLFLENFSNPWKFYP
jgi:hypothetical protein